ncbi:MAG: DUF4124 domain-containing protein [Gammaproteobacteria bacterium]|nr:DUF4124 domain-containing protein [Gammaproteobacteria bacterium]
MSAALRIIAMLVVAGIGTPSWAQIYQYVDEHGVVHFSDSPPAQDNHRIIEQADLDAITTTVPGTPLPSAADQRRDEVARQRNRAAQTSSLQRLQAEQAAQSNRCDSYQARLDTIQSRLRAGYGIQEGNRLREARREIRVLMGRECHGR